LNNNNKTMAKQINFTHPESGANFPKAYFRIQQCDITKDEPHSVGVIYYGYADAESASENKQPVFTKRTQIENISITTTDDFRALIYTQEADLFFAAGVNV